MTSHSKTIKLELTPAELLALHDEMEDTFRCADAVDFESAWHKVQDALTRWVRDEGESTITITPSSNMKLNTHISERDLIDEDYLTSLNEEARAEWLLDEMTGE